MAEAVMGEAVVGAVGAVEAVEAVEEAVEESASACAPYSISAR